MNWTTVNTAQFMSYVIAMEIICSLKKKYTKIKHLCIARKKIITTTECLRWLDYLYRSDIYFFFWSSRRKEIVITYYINRDLFQKL